MTKKIKNIAIVYDNREQTSSALIPLVGCRRYGDIVFCRKRIESHVRSSIPKWGLTQFYAINDTSDLENIRAVFKASKEPVGVLIISALAGLTDHHAFAQLVERLPYANYGFTNSRYKPLLCYYHDSSELLAQWEELERAPLHRWEKPWTEFELLETVAPLNLSELDAFLSFIAGSTEPRHFNSLSMDDFFYTKSSQDVDKIHAEYNYYRLLPEKMQSWMVQPFDYKESNAIGSYKMMRYYLSDTALQWVHHAFTLPSFIRFIDRLLFFIKDRTQKNCDKNISLEHAEKVIIEKLDQRFVVFSSDKACVKINNLVAASNPTLDLATQIERLKFLFRKHKKSFATDHLAVGHGDPCFSNILYDQQRYVLKFIDPKGANTEADLWVHPFYDLCKISHSVLGDYDFINNGLFELILDDSNNITLKIESESHGEHKKMFLQRLAEQGYDWRIVRLAEASLFLSMLPLHMDYPKKVIAFMLTAHQILNEVEYD